MKWRLQTSQRKSVIPYLFLMPMAVHASEVAEDPAVVAFAAARIPISAILEDEVENFAKG
jgi:hypothetical protein